MNEDAALRVLIVDDHEVTRRGLRDLLRDVLPRVEVREAGDQAALMARLGEGGWSLIILDLLLPDCGVLELLHGLRDEARRTPILVVTAVPDAAYVVESLKAGIRGYVHKHKAAEELARAMKTVLAGEVYLDSDGARLMAERFDRDRQSRHQDLSPRELDVFLLLARGLTIKEVAHELSLSHKTVSTYLTRIRDKTGLTSLVDIARYALQHRLVT